MFSFVVWLLGAAGLLVAMLAIVAASLLLVIVVSSLRANSKQDEEVRKWLRLHKDDRNLFNRNE